MVTNRIHAFKRMFHQELIFNVVIIYYYYYYFGSSSTKRLESEFWQYRISCEEFRMF